ncbi:MAG: methyl-accepting chemotaxis protein [SAR324 cluster bacterium]|nr:methyl-accepting chemotaxis protein [SAR324 cluster bacterium]
MILKTLLQSVSNWFIPERLQKDFLVFRQSKIIVYYSFIGILFYSYNIIKWYNLNKPILAVSLTVIICLTILMLFVVKFTGQYQIAGHSSVIALFFHFSFLAYLGGGLDAKTILWNLIIPMISYIIIGIRPAFFWSLIMLIEVIVFYKLKTAGHVFPGLGLDEAESLKQQVINTVGPLCALSIGLFLFEILNKLTLTEATKSQQKSQTAADLLRGVINNVNDQAKTLADSSQSLLGNNVVIEDNISVTVNSVSNITSLVNQLSALTDRVNQHSSKVMVTSEKGLSTTESGMVSLQEMKGKMSQIENSSETSTKEIIELSNHSKKINNVMDIINGVADQTKLIAFNASLEASSAGEAGKRFSVVAVEIRRLADNVMESTSEIRATIKNINESVERLLIYSEKGSQDIQEGISSLDEIVNTLNQILADAKIQSELAKDIIQHTDEQAQINNQVLQKTTEISDSSHETSQSVQQSGIIATKLASVSKELKQQLAKS